METSSSNQNQPTPLFLLPTVTQLLRRSFDFYNAHLSLFMMIGVVPFLAGLTHIFFLGNGFGPVAALFLLPAAFLAVFYRLALLSLATGNADPMGGALYVYKKGLKMFVPFLWVSILTGIAALGGVFFFVVPGIALSVWISFASYVLFAENKKGTSALAQSWHYVRGYWWQVFWRVFSLAFVFAIFMLFMGIGLRIFGEQVLAIGNLFLEYLILTPLGVFYSYYLYSSLREAKKESISFEGDKQLKKWVVFFAVAGVTGIIAFAVFAGFFFFETLTQNPISFIPFSSVFASSGLGPLLELFQR